MMEILLKIETFLGNKSLKLSKNPYTVARHGIINVSAFLTINDTLYKPLFIFFIRTDPSCELQFIYKVRFRAVW